MKSAAYYIWKAELSRCNGRYENGPKKAYAKCKKCGHVDYEKYEGDICKQPIKEAA